MVHFEIKNLSFRYPFAQNKEALSDINLKMKKGEYLTLCGESGCGKTTLLRHFKSALTPHGERKGEVLFKGIPIEGVDLKTQSAKIGYVMQNPMQQIVTDKVWHELAFGLECLGTDSNTIRLRVAEMASYFGMESWFHREVAELSGGQMQLLNLASIMVMQPEILILDEPTSQLDPIAASDFLNTIRRINQELGTTILITEHRLEDVFSASDRVVVMEKGKIIAADEPRMVGELLKKNHHPIFSAMPAPIQIYYGLMNDKKCPLTVREGREWLSCLFADKEPEITEIVDAKGMDSFEQKRCVVELKDVWFRYERNGNDILKGVDMKFFENGFFAVVGGNGAGKSTLLKTICKLCKPYRGKVRTKGKVAMLPQNPESLFAKKTLKEDLEEMLFEKGNSNELQEVSELCEIAQLLDTASCDLSGGELQRAALAKVLLAKPDILLLDEPTKGMDGCFKIKFAKMIQGFKDKGMTIIMVSHDIEFCAEYTDSVSMFFDGGILTTNSPREFFARNSFYTTAPNRMSRHIFKNAVTREDVVALCQKNSKG